MKAACVVESRATLKLDIEDVPKPRPQRGELLIEVHAAGVTPTELLWDPTTHNKDGTLRKGAVPGHEFSGIVAEVGEGVNTFSIGEEVYGMNDWYANGATAEFCVTIPPNIARKPTDLTHSEAASVPVGALTAHQGLFDRADLNAGERLLVHGAAGAVGVFVVQMARLRGAEVIVTASAQHSEFLLGLGAKQVIDYHASLFEKNVRDVDVVFDAVGGDTLTRSWNVLKSTGRLVTIAAESEGTSDPRVKDGFFIVEPNAKQLGEIGGLLDKGELRTFIDAEVSLENAAAAYARKVERKHRYGKVVIVTPALERTMAA
jgi:NADPH:quinone reductase-like Zn-dependent oxidoreductase